MTETSCMNTCSLLAAFAITITVGCSEPTARAHHSTSITAEPIYIVGPSYRGAALKASTLHDIQEPDELATEGGDFESDIAATPEDEATTSLPPATTSPALLELKRLEMARGIEDHEPLGSSDHFTPSLDPLFAFLQVVNRSVEEREVVVTYEHEDGSFVGPARLTVPSSDRGYRTFTRTTWVRRPGRWTASVSTPDGTVLGQTEFTVGEDQGA